MLSRPGILGRQTRRVAAGAGGGAPTWLTSATVMADGDTLEIRGQWPSSTFFSFDLDPDGSPKITLTATGAGYDVAAGQAVANSARARSGIIGTKPLRRVQPNQTQLDEVVSGPDRVVKIALSRTIHAGEPCTVTFAAGWRDGLSGGSAAVVNNSGRLVSLPSFRWQTPNSLLKSGPFRVDMLVAHAWAEGAKAIAAARFTATDGTNTFTGWIDAPTVSPDYGDGLKCWGITIDPAAAVPAPLTPGLITVQFEAFPHIGVPRATGTGHNTDLSAGWKLPAQSPLHVVYDPAGTMFPQAHVYIDKDVGNLTANANMVFATLAAAKAAGATFWARNVGVANQAVYLANRTIPAANGVASFSRAGDNALFTFAAGVHSLASAQATTSGFTLAQARQIWRGDPDNANPRANCIIETGADVGLRSNRHLFENLTVRLGVNAMPSSMSRIHTDNCTIEGKAGSKLATTSMTGAVAAGEFNLTMTRSRWWGYGAGPVWGATQRFGFHRGCEGSRGTIALSAARYSRLASDPDVAGLVSGAGGPAAATAVAAGVGAAEDIFVWQCDLRRTSTTCLSLCTSNTGATTLLAGVALRHNYIGNLIEKIGADPNPIQQATGEDVYTVSTDCIWEGNTLVGDRINLAYCSPADAATDLISRGNVVRNNIFDWAPIKGDDFIGRLSGLTGNWSLRYGTNCHDNVLLGRNEGLANNWEWMFVGVGCLTNPNWGTNFLYAGFVNDQCASADTNLNGVEDQAASVGGGDYRLQAGSPALARARTGCIDVSRTGAALVAPWPAGSEVAS
jgi:hypothetical protein